MDFDQEIREMLATRARTMQDFRADYRPLNMYAIYRADLEMPPGKLAAQCGHAYVNAMAAAIVADAGILAAYTGTGNGTKICMYAKNETQLLRAYREARDAGVPCALIIDRGHILPPHFDGSPVITAVGIGPTYADVIRHITKRYTLTR